MDTNNDEKIIKRQKLLILSLLLLLIALTSYLLYFTYNESKENKSVKQIQKTTISGMYTYYDLIDKDKPDFDEDGTDDYEYCFINLESNGKYYYEASSSFTSQTNHIGFYKVNGNKITLKAEKDSWLKDLNEEWEINVIDDNSIELDINLHSFEKRDKPITLKKITDKVVISDYSNLTYEKTIENGN